MAVNKYNHRRYYNSMKNRKQIGKFDIKSGMIVTFGYPGYDKNPLVFVLNYDQIPIVRCFYYQKSVF